MSFWDWLQTTAVFQFHNTKGKIKKDQSDSISARSNWCVTLQQDDEQHTGGLEKTRGNTDAVNLFNKESPVNLT